MLATTKTNLKPKCHLILRKQIIQMQWTFWKVNLQLWEHLLQKSLATNTQPPPVTAPKKST